MPKSGEKALRAREPRRDINAELRADLRLLKRGVVGRVTVLRTGKTVELPTVKVRFAAGLSQAEFAALLGVSVRTLQRWEQGRREPTGAARTLIKIAERFPDALRAVI